MSETYLYARVGGDERVEVLRLAIGGDGIPLPGGDQPTTPAVGSVVVDHVELDSSGTPVLVALDPTPTRGGVDDALAEGWQRPPDSDPVVTMLTKAGDPRRPA